LRFLLIGAIHFLIFESVNLWLLFNIQACSCISLCFFCALCGENFMIRCLSPTSWQKKCPGFPEHFFLKTMALVSDFVMQASQNVFKYYSAFLDFFSVSSMSAFRLERTSKSPKVDFSTLLFTFLTAFSVSSFSAFLASDTATLSL